MKRPDKTTRDFLIAAVTALVLACLAATGFALRFRFPEHDETASIVAHGGAEPTWLGFDEEALETVHFYYALTLLALILLHIVLHAKWLWTISKGRDAKWTLTRTAAFFLFLAVLLILISAPFWT